MAWRGMHSRRGIPAHISDMHMCISRCGKKADPDGLAGLCLEAVEAGQSVLVFCSSKVYVCTPVHMYTYIHVYTYHNISKAKTESCARFLAEFLPADATSLGRSGGGGRPAWRGSGRRAAMCVNSRQNETIARQHEQKRGRRCWRSWRGVRRAWTPRCRHEYTHIYMYTFT